MNLKYTGSAHTRELTKANFTTLGVEHGKTSFTKGEVVEVPDEVGAALLKLGGFTEVKAEAKAEAPVEPMTDPITKGK